MGHVRFEDLKKLQYFKIDSDLGTADMQKRSQSQALCFDSENASYEKGNFYFICPGEIVIPE